MKSSLRKSRYSTSSSNTSSLLLLSNSITSINEVSFSTKVDIVVYQKPKEFWSTEDWNKYFI